MSKPIGRPAVHAGSSAPAPPVLPEAEDRALLQQTQLFGTRSQGLARHGIPTVWQGNKINFLSWRTGHETHFGSFTREAGMSSILFAIEVVAFLVVAAWAYRNDRIAAEEGGTGLLALRSTGDAPPVTQQRWRRDFRAKGTYA